MKTKKTFPVLFLAAVAGLSLLGGCVHVESDEPSSRTTTTTSTRPSVVAPASTTTVQRTTTY